jgi:hypothetical protein
LDRLHFHAHRFAIADGQHDAELEGFEPRRRHLDAVSIGVQRVRKRQRLRCEHAVDS